MLLCRSLEVMRLIAGICNFNDDQLVTVGLKVPPAPSIQLPAPGKLISSLYGAFVGGDTGKSNTSTGNAANRLDSHNGRQRPTPLEASYLLHVAVMVSMCLIQNIIFNIYFNLIGR